MYTYTTRRQALRFTLIELLAVVALTSVLMALGVPAFLRMIRGNKVDECARSIKLAMEQAQMRAASERRYVAVIFPNGDISDSLKTYRMGGYRTAYVKKGTKGTYIFSKWVDPEWRNAPGVAMLVKIETGTSGVSPNSHGVVSGCSERNTTEIAGEGTDKLKALKDIKDDNGNTLKCGDNCALVYSPYGEVKCSSKLYFLISEAELGEDIVNTSTSQTGQKIVYPSTREGGKTANFRVLQVNNHTGRVEFYEKD